MEYIAQRLVNDNAEDTSTIYRHLKHLGWTIETIHGRVIAHGHPLFPRSNPIFFIPATDHYGIIDIWMRDFDHIWLTGIQAERSTWQIVRSVLNRSPRCTCQLYLLAPGDLRHNVVRCANATVLVDNDQITNLDIRYSVRHDAVAGIPQ